jgi:hypothetical protein
MRYLLALVLVAGCASGREYSADDVGDDDDTVAIDARPGDHPDGNPGDPPDAHPPPPDAHPPPPDAHIPPDAEPPPPPDAGLFCTDNSQCTNAGTCCLSFGGPGFCVPGTPIGDACLPDT